MSKPESNQPESSQQGAVHPAAAKGSYTVGILLLIAVVAAGTAFVYWNNFVQVGDPPGKKNATQEWDKQAAIEDLVNLEREFSQAKQSKRFNTILQKTRAFVERNPKFPDAYTLLGKVYIEMYQWEKAYEAFETSLNLDERQPMVHHLAGTMCYEMRQYEVTEEHYAQAKFLDPENPLHHVYLAQVHIKTNRLDSALKLLLVALRLDSEYHEAYATMSDLFLKQNDLPRALQQVDQAMRFVQQELDNRSMVVEYVIKRAKILRRMNEPDAAMQEFENNLHDIEHALPPVASEIAVTWGALGKPEKAADFLDTIVLKTERMDVQILEMAAEWQIRVKRLPMAEQYIQRIIDIDPTQKSIERLQGMVKSARQKQDADAKAS